MMSSVKTFQAPLVCLPIPGETDAVLMQDWTVMVRGWTIFIPAFTKTDGASVPRWLWPMCGHPLVSPRVYAAIVHDFIYGGGGPCSIDRNEADLIYRELLVRFGWGSFRANVEYCALRMFGSSHWTDR